MKKSFLIYIDSLDVLDDLTDDQVSILFRSIKKYVNGEDVILDGMLKAIFTLFKNQIDRDNEKYERICERRRESGKKGGLAKASKCYQLPAKASKSKQNLANLAHNDKDKDNDNKKEKVKKEKYLEFVLLTNAEHTKLLSMFGKEITNSFIEKLNNYIGSKGKRYKSHYHTILNWNRMDSDRVDKTLVHEKPPMH